MTPREFLDGRANTIYVVAAGHDQEVLRPVILALLAATYETAIVRARRDGALQPRLFMLMDEAANIAPVRNLALVAFAVRRSRHRDRDDLAVDRADRPALWASSARRDLRRIDRSDSSIPPLAEPTSAGYLSELLGEETVANTSQRRLPSHARGRAAEDRPNALAQTDRARPGDPRLPRPAARDRACARMVRGSTLRSLRQVARVES